MERTMRVSVIGEGQKWDWNSIPSATLVCKLHTWADRGHTQESQIYGALYLEAVLSTEVLEAR